jgi:hypothetical protein
VAYPKQSIQRFQPCRNDPDNALACRVVTITLGIGRT